MIVTLGSGKSIDAVTPAVTDTALRVPSVPGRVTDDVICQTFALPLLVEFTGQWLKATAPLWFPRPELTIMTEQLSPEGVVASTFSPALFDGVCHLRPWTVRTA
jgi:hypothetical protein